MLSFVDRLKQVIADIQITGGAPVEHSTPSSSLLQKLREYALQRAENRAPEWTLLEWFTEGFFDEYVRVCVVHLRKLGISDDNLVFKFIAKVVDSQLSAEAHRWERKEGDFEEQLAFSLIDIWEQMGDEQTLIYTFAQERWLIAWDYQKSHWKATSLGQLLLELSPVQAATFLLSIDTLFSTGRHDFRHISAEVLNSLLHPQSYKYKPFRLIPLHRDILTRLGILREPDDYVPDRIKLTPVGKVVLRRVLDKDNPLRDAASALIETEETERGKKLEDWQASRRTRQVTERRDNPYVANVPVSDPKMFFGRQEIRNQIVNGIHLNNFAVCGPKRIGKTSLLHRLAAELRQMDDAPCSFFPVLLSLHGIPESHLFRTLMSAIVREYRSQIAPLALRCRAEGEYNAYDFLDDLDIVQETLQQAVDKPLRLVLLVDEGDALNGYSQATLAQLRFVFMGPALNYLKMVWSGEDLDRRKWKLHGSDWLTVFGHVFHLTPFTEEEATRLIVEPVPYYHYDKQAVRLILDHSQLIPHRIQLLCRGAVEEMLKAQRGRITVEDVEASIRHLTGETAPPGIQPFATSVLAADSREQPARRLAEGDAGYHTDEENEGPE